MVEINDRLEISVVDQTFRFMPKEPPTFDQALTLPGARKVGEEVTITRMDPWATLVFEKTGGIVVFGISRSEVAKLTVRESLLRLGLPEDGISMEKGPMVMKFTTGRAVISSVATNRISEVKSIDSLGAVEISATRFGGVILIFPSGKGFAIGMRSKRIGELAIRTYLEILEQEGALA